MYEAFGWEVPTYVHCSPVMRDAQNKMSKRHGDPSYEDLKAEGYLTEAILNYVALLGWSPKGELAEQELFTLPELVKAFDMTGISKSPAIFDRQKLDHFNAVYLRGMAPEAFAKAAEPYIRQTVTDPRFDTAAIAALLQARCEKLTDIPEKVDFFDALPSYDVSLYTNKKSKTNEEVSLRMLEAALPALEALPARRPVRAGAWALALCMLGSSLLPRPQPASPQEIGSLAPLPTFTYAPPQRSDLAQLVALRVYVDGLSAQEPKTAAVIASSSGSNSSILPFCRTLSSPCAWRRQWVPRPGKLRLSPAPWNTP